MNRKVNGEPEERELLDSYERDEWRSVDMLRERLREYQAYAIAAFEAIGFVGIVPRGDVASGESL